MVILTFFVTGKEKTLRLEIQGGASKNKNEKHGGKALLEWHEQRLLEADSKSHGKADEEERQRWSEKVTAVRDARTSNPWQSAARLCAGVSAGTLRTAEVVVEPKPAVLHLHK